MFKTSLWTQIISFSLVGIAATLTHYSVAFSALYFCGPFIANLFGYSAAVAISYFGHQRYSFQSTTAGPDHARQLPRFLLLSISALLLSQAILLLAVSVEVPEAFALGVAVLIVPPYTFTISRLWVFD